MSVQKSIFEDGGHSIKYIEGVNIDLVEISKYNPRKTWDNKHVERLAQLIESNGFDKAFAVKCHKENDGLRCFAGSNRLKAARKAGKQFIPVFLYEGYEGREIWRMAYEDNEQADAQQQFNTVDVWLDYKEKSAAGMTQQQIADSLGVSQTNVAFRLKFAEWPETVLSKFITNDSLKEGHAREMRELLQCNIFPHETLLCEIIDNVLARSKEPTSKQFKKEVEKYNSAISAAKEAADRLESPWCEQFIEKIQYDRNAASISNQGTIYLKKQQETQAEALAAKLADLSEEEEKLKNQQAEIKKAEKIKAITDWIICGDSTEEASNAPEGIRLILTDPPYGQGFQSNRRVSTAKANKIENDEELMTALRVTKLAIQGLAPKLMDDAALLIWCNWRYEPDFRQMIEAEGWTIKNSIIWVKNNHGTGDLSGTFAPKHERVLFATKGKVELKTRIPDVINGGEFLPTEHPTPKPLDVLDKFIDCLTLEGEIVADPFMGHCSTGVSSIRSNRRFWGCDKDKQWWEESMTNITNLIK